MSLVCPAVSFSRIGRLQIRQLVAAHRKAPVWKLESRSRPPGNPHMPFMSLRPRLQVGSSGEGPCERVSVSLPLGAESVRRVFAKPPPQSRLRLTFAACAAMRAPRARSRSDSGCNKCDDSSVMGVSPSGRPELNAERSIEFPPWLPILTSARSCLYRKPRPAVAGSSSIGIIEPFPYPCACRLERGCLCVLVATEQTFSPTLLAFAAQIFK